jgi:BioD-like phosphotransacetylase family protein
MSLYRDSRPSKVRLEGLRLKHILAFPKVEAAAAYPETAQPQNDMEIYAAESHQVCSESMQSMGFHFKEV